MDKNAKSGGDILTLVAWADKNRKQLIWGVGLVVAVGAAFGARSMYRDHREDAANAAFCALKQPGTGAATADAAQFAQVAESYPDTSAGVRAMLTAGSLYFEAGDYDNSRKMFDRVVAEHPEYPLASTASLGVAVCLEMEGKKDEAAAHYQAILNRSAPDYTWPQARSALARIYTEEGQPQKAFEIYKQMLQGGGNNDTWTMEARVQVSELLEKNPALRQQAMAEAAAANGAPVVNTVKP